MKREEKMIKDHKFFMKVALEEAARARDKGNVAVGAVLVRKGEIVARGTHQQLMEESPIYAEIYNSQLVEDAVYEEMAEQSIA